MPSHFSVDRGSGGRRIPCRDRRDGLALLLLAASAPANPNCPKSEQRAAGVPAGSYRDIGAAAASTSTRPRISTPPEETEGGPTIKREPTSPTRRRSPSPLRSPGRPQQEGYRRKGGGGRKESTASKRKKTGILDNTKDCLGQAREQGASSGNTYEEPGQWTHGEGQDGSRPAAMDLNHDVPDAASSVGGTSATNPIRLSFSSRKKDEKLVWSQIRKACDRCTSKKVRCDGSNGERGFQSCSACKKAGEVCVFGICRRSGPRDSKGHKTASAGTVVNRDQFEKVTERLGKCRTSSCSFVHRNGAFWREHYHCRMANCTFAGRNMSALLVHRGDIHPECLDAAAAPITTEEASASIATGKRPREEAGSSETEETPSTPPSAKRSRH